MLWSLFWLLSSNFQMVTFLIEYDCYPNIWVVSRGMVSPGGFFFGVGMNVVLHVHILELKVGLSIFHSPTSVLSQCIISLPSMWLPCIYPLALISGERHDLFLNISPQNHQLPRWSWLVNFDVSIVLGFCLRGVSHTALGVLLGHHVLYILPGGVHTLP